MHQARELAEALLADGGEKCVPAVEVLVDRSCRHACSLGCFTQAQAVGAGGPDLGHRMVNEGKGQVSMVIGRFMRGFRGAHVYGVYIGEEPA